jgi:hypothetical protein
MAWHAATSELACACEGAFEARAQQQQSSSAAHARRNTRMCRVAVRVRNALGAGWLACAFGCHSQRMRHALLVVVFVVAAFGGPHTGQARWPHVQPSESSWAAGRPGVRPRAAPCAGAHHEVDTLLYTECDACAMRLRGAATGSVGPAARRCAAAAGVLIGGRCAEPEALWRPALEMRDEQAAVAGVAVRAVLVLAAADTRPTATGLCAARLRGCVCACTQAACAQRLRRSVRRAAAASGTATAIAFGIDLSRQSRVRHGACLQARKAL